MNRAHDKKVKDNMDEYTYIIVTAIVPLRDLLKVVVLFVKTLCGMHGMV